MEGSVPEVHRGGCMGRSSGEAVAEAQCEWIGGGMDSFDGEDDCDDKSSVAELD